MAVNRAQVSGKATAVRTGSSYRLASGDAGCGDRSQLPPPHLELCGRSRMPVAHARGKWEQQDDLCRRRAAVLNVLIASSQDRAVSGCAGVDEYLLHAGASTKLGIVLGGYDAEQQGGSLIERWGAFRRYLGWQ